MIQYNTQLPKMELPEYGRNIYEMVQQCLELHDRDKRNRMAANIIRVMARVLNQDEMDENLERVLWNHLARISNYQLDVDYPYPITQRNQLTVKPAPIHNSQSQFTWRTYGKVIEEMIHKACQIEDHDQRMRSLELCANQMKREFVLANPLADNVDNKIMDDLLVYTNGRFAEDLFTGIYLFDDSELLQNNQYDESKLIETKKKKKKKK